MSIRIKEIALRRHHVWEANPLKLSGKIVFEDENTKCETSLVIGDEACERIIAMMADGLVEHAQSVSGLMKQSLLAPVEAQKLTEA